MVRILSGFHFQRLVNLLERIRGPVLESFGNCFLRGQTRQG